MLRVPREIRSLVAAIPRLLLLLARLMTDVRVSVADRAILAATIVYAVSPLDLIPDFIPLVGQLDDLYLVALAIDRLLMNAGADLVREHWTGSEEVLESLQRRLDSLARFLPAAVERSLAGWVRTR